MPKIGFCKNRSVKHKSSGRTKIAGRNVHPTQNPCNTVPVSEPWRSDQGSLTETRRTSKPPCQKCAARCQNCTKEAAKVICHVAIAVDPTDIVQIQFDAQKGELDSEIMVHVAKGYTGSPLLSAEYIRRVQAKCWRTRPEGGVISTLPDGNTMITTSQVISKLQKGNKFYRVVFGVVEGDEAMVFSKQGWQIGTRQTDAVIGSGLFCVQNEIPKNLCKR